MPGVKRKSSFATPDDTPSKLARRSTTDKLTPAKPTSLPKFPSGTSSKKTKEIALSGSSPSDGSDLESPTPPLLRRASTLTVEEKEASLTKKAGGKEVSVTKKASSKRSSTSSKLSLTKKVSSVSVEDGTITTVVPLKSGSSIGETSLVTKESLKKAESITKPLSKAESGKGTDSLIKSLSKTASVRSTSSGKGASEDKDEPMAVDPGLPPGGLLEVAISFDTTGSMYGCLEEVRAKVKDLAQRLQADIPGIRIAIIAHGDYCDADKYIVKWIDFGASLPELCDFVENVERTGGGDGPECYELVLKRAREELAWTAGSQRVLVVIGDNEPHQVGYKYGGQTYYIDWREECESLKNMGVKVYGVKANAFGDVYGFFKEAPELTGGQFANLKNFSSIFDFLMMICYREGNPDMMPVYASEVRARHVGGMAKDMEELVKKFGGASGSKTSFTAFPTGMTATLKTAKGLTKAGRKITAKPKKTAKAAKAAKPASKAKKAMKKPKTTTDKKKVKKTVPKTSIKKIKGKAKKKVPKKKPVIKKKLFRERIPDAKLMTGPLKKLEWSEWYLAISQHLPMGYNYKKLQKSQMFGGCYLRRNLFDNAKNTPAVYEVGVKYTHFKKKIHVMYNRASRGSSTNKRLILYIVRNKKVRSEVDRLVSMKFDIYIRRGVSKAKNKVKSMDDIKTAAGHLNSFDYAWGRHGKKGHRKVVKEKQMLSDNSL